MWARYRHHNEVRPLIREILRLQRKLRIVADLQDDAYQALGRPEGEIHTVVALLRIALQNEPDLIDRVSGKSEEQVDEAVSAAAGLISKEDPTLRPEVVTAINLHTNTLR